MICSFVVFNGSFVRAFTTNPSPFRSRRLPGRFLVGTAHQRGQEIVSRVSQHLGFDIVIWSPKSCDCCPRKKIDSYLQHLNVFFGGQKMVGMPKLLDLLQALRVMKDTRPKRMVWTWGSWWCCCLAANRLGVTGGSWTNIRQTKHNWCKSVRIYIYYKNPINSYHIHLRWDDLPNWGEFIKIHTVL